MRPPGGADGRVEAARRQRAVFTETVVDVQVAARMVHTPRYTYAVYERGWYREQLFDMREDPGEMVNLAVEAAGQTRHRTGSVDGGASDMTR